MKKSKISKIIDVELDKPTYREIRWDRAFTFAYSLYMISGLLLILVGFFTIAGGYRANGGILMVIGALMAWFGGHHLNKKAEAKDKKQ